MREFGVVDYIEALTAKEYLEKVRLEGPIRFDFDEVAGRTDHPAAHVTIGRECCRIPMFGPLSIGHFLRLTFRHFYPQWWEEHDAIRGWPLRWFDRTLADDDRLTLHFEWRQPLLERLAGAVRRRR